MNAHHFLEGTKVSRFFLALVGEARLWYESFQPINIDWQGLQNLFRQQYSKIGNRGEELFHARRSFHFDQNTETIDAYVTCISSYMFRLWGATNFRSIQKHTPYKILLGIIYLRQAVKTAKKNINKRKDRKLARQSSSTPFISVKDNYNKKVAFDT